MINDYIDRLIHSHINHWSNPLLRTRVSEIVKEAMKDQRQACVEAVDALQDSPVGLSSHVVRRAVQKARPKGDSL
jgi:hypothetical protein